MSRGHESGMDFEYQNFTGPMDSRSPFANISQNAQRFPRSPSKQSPSKPLPPVPAFNSLYNTPRKMTIDIDDSSAGETPKSPEQTEKNATPDTLGRSMLSNAQPKLDGVNRTTQAGADRERSSPTKEKERPTPHRRESLFGRIKSRWYSPGRGEIPRTDHGGAIEKRVKRRREKELHRQVSRRRRHSVSDSGEDGELPAKSPRKTSGKVAGKHVETAEHQPGWLSSTFTFIAQHPTVPHILSFYAQLLFNIFLLASCAYLVYCFWSAVQGDVDKKSHEAMAHIMAEMAVCAKGYSENKCDRDTRLPALEIICDNWSRCMNQDPTKVGRARVSAHTFAEIFNSFVEPISWKAMIFTFLLVFGCFATTNLAFGFFRDKSANAGQHYSPSYYQPPPPTPQRTFGGENAYYGTPWHQAPMALEPAPSGRYGEIEGRGSPVRRLVYN